MSRHALPEGTPSDSHSALAGDLDAGAASSDVLPTSHRSGGSRRRERRGSSWRELPILIVIALVLALLIKTFLVQAFYIPSGSMENTLHIGDRVLVNRLVYRFSEPQRGDIVVFNGVDSWTPEVSITQPTNPVVRVVRDVAGLFGFASPNETDFIKRVIGVPGDHVACCDEQGRITVNGVPLNEPYVYPGNPPSLQKFNIVVPPGRLWVMGDHRSASSDSRYHLGDPGGGTIPINKVIGKAFLVAWPISHLQFLSTPSTFKNPALDASQGSG